MSNPRCSLLKLFVGELLLVLLFCLFLMHPGMALLLLQEDALRWGLDVVVGTPGRLLDHVGRGTLQLCDAEFLILDEADQMLDMGFKEEMEKVRRGWYRMG